MTPEEFFKAMMPYARKVSERTGLDPRLVLAQSALETGYGKSAPNSNYFGIKGAGQVFPSEEFFDGKMVVEPSEFRAYENPQQSFDDYASFITGNKRYEPVLKAKTLSDQIAAMGASGYATDPNYGAKLSSIANMIGEDILPKGTSMATPMDRAREEELRMQMLATGMAPRTAPRAPLSALRQDRPQAAAAPQQRRSGLGGIMDYLGKQSPTTGLSRAEQFAAALDPLIMPEMRSGEAIRARGAQRQATATKNKTVEYLRRMGYNDYADAVESGSIGAKDIMNALVSKSLEAPKDTSTAGMREYAQAVKDGFKGTFLDYKTAISKAGATSVNVGGDGTFQEYGQKELGRNYAEMAAAGRDASANLGRIELLSDLLDESDTGLSAGFLSRANQYFGVDFRSGPAAAAEAIISQLVPAQRPAGSGVISDADLALYKASLPAIQNQPNGNKLIIGSMVAITKHNQSVGRIASRALTDPNFSIQQAEEAIAALPDPFESVRGLLGSGADIPAPSMTEEEALKMLKPPSGG